MRLIILNLKAALFLLGTVCQQVEGFQTIPQPLFHVLQLIHRDSIKLAGSSLKHAIKRVRDAQVS